MILKELAGFAVLDSDKQHLIIRNNGDGKVADLAVGYALGVLNQRYPECDRHEVRVRDYPDNMVLSVRVFKREEYRGPDWIPEAR